MNYKMITAIIATLVSITASASRESGSFRVPMGIKIQYISIGSGIDNEAQDRIENLIRTEQAKHTVQYIKTSDWGMEGESTVCVQFKSFNDSLRVSETLLPIAAEYKYTKASLVGTCDSVGNAKVDPAFELAE
ncbi:MAG: hypothetical protein V4692_16850 [Bdellovibrionota bacterium]